MLVELIIGGKEAGPNELRMCKAPTFSALSRTLRHRLFKEGVQLSPPPGTERLPPCRRQNDCRGLCQLCHQVLSLTLNVSGCCEEPHRVHRRACLLGQASHTLESWPMGESLGP